MMKALARNPAIFGCDFIFMLITVGFLSGCSGSSDSIAAGIQESAVDSSSIVSNDSQDEISNETPITNDVITVAEVEPISEIDVEENIDVTENESLNNAPFVTDPEVQNRICLLYTSPSPRDRQKSRMPSSA